MIVFDKDGVILDLEATWLPVARAVAQYTASRIPDDWDGNVGAPDLLAAIGVNDKTGLIDSRYFCRWLFCRYSGLLADNAS